jgi:hypothetical protein
LADRAFRDGPVVILWEGMIRMRFVSLIIRPYPGLPGSNKNSGYDHSIV